MILLYFTFFKSFYLFSQTYNIGKRNDSNFLAKLEANRPTAHACI
jgi:hypothetical protein